MNYNFDREIPRIKTASVKWDILEDRFGSSDLLSMWVADMDFEAPAPVIEALKDRLNHGILGYTQREIYYDSLIQWIWRRHDWSINNKWLINVPGVVPALGLIIETFTNPGDKVIIQQPVYYPFSNLVTRNNRTLVNNRLYFDGNQYTMDFDDLEEKMSTGAKLLILCNPHNPVGRVWSREELTRLGEMCVAHNVLVVSDEIHCDLTLPGHRYTPFASINDAFAQRSLTGVAASKTFNIAGLQTATVIAPNDALREALQKTLSKYALGAANVFGVIAADSAYRHGEEWLNQLLEYIQGNVNFLTDFINNNIPEMDVIVPEGTYLVWIDCKRMGMDNKELDEFFTQRAKVALDIGGLFGTEGERFARLNVACPRSVLERALWQICSAVKEITEAKRHTTI